MNCIVLKAAKAGLSSFRITQMLIETVYQKARKVKRKGELILTIPCDDKNEYVLNCLITKRKR